jgi:hypothetical protein
MIMHDDAHDQTFIKCLHRECYTYNYTQHEDHVHSEIDRVTEGSVGDGHAVLIIVAPREEATEFIWGHAPARHQSCDPRDRTRVGSSHTGDATSSVVRLGHLYFQS